MSKIRLSTAALALAAAPALAQLSTPLPSPNATVAQTIGITKAEVVYSRPSVRGRVIWGELVPYDQVWRTGANAITKIRLYPKITSLTVKLPRSQEGEFTCTLFAPKTRRNNCCIMSETPQVASSDSSTRR